MNNPACFKRSEIKLESVDGIKYEYFHSHLSYSEPLIVLVHGYISTMDEFSLIARKLSRKFNIITVNLPGVSRSSVLKSEYNLQNLSQWLNNFLQSFRYKRIILAGHSMGGIICTDYAHRFPKGITGLMGICTPSSGKYINPVWKNAMNTLIVACKSSPVEKIIENISDNESLIGHFFPLLEKLNLMDDLDGVTAEIKLRAIKEQHVIPAARYANILLDYSLIPILKELPDLKKLFIIGKNDDIVDFETVNEFRIAHIPGLKIVLKKYFSHFSIMINPDLTVKYISDFAISLR